MGSIGSRQSSVPAWRLEDPRYQQQTAGGVYFWSSPNAVYGKDIDEKMYNRLPKKMQSAVIALENSKTMDGNHATIYFVNSSGMVDYYDEYGLSDFYSTIRTIKDVGNVADWQYTEGDYKVGQRLRRK